MRERALYILHSPTMYMVIIITTITISMRYKMYRFLSHRLVLVREILWCSKCLKVNQILVKAAQAWQTVTTNQTKIGATEKKVRDLYKACVYIATVPS